jgi:hypothetical protein
MSDTVRSDSAVEPGGLRALNLCHRRAAIQASTTVLSAFTPAAS